MLRSDFQADLNMVNHRGGLVRGEESVRTQEKKVGIGRLAQGFSSEPEHVSQEKGARERETRRMIVAE